MPSRPAHPGRRHNPHVAERQAPAPDPGQTGQASAARSAPAQAFLARFARTLAVLLLSMAALLLGWNLVSGTDWASSHPWLTATAATTGWVLAVAVWLRRRGWRRGPVHVVTWAAPTVGLLPLVWLGWLTPDGLILWGPVSTLFAVALAMAADPIGVDGVLRGQMLVVRDGAESPLAGTPALHGDRPARHQLREPDEHPDSGTDQAQRAGPPRRGAGDQQHAHHGPGNRPHGVQREQHR
jgi:hypothetical protein